MNDEMLSTDQVRRPNLQSQAVEFHRSMVDADEESLDGWKRHIGVRTYRFLLLLIDECLRTELPRRAAALTYTTILSIFPILAVLTSVLSAVYTERAEQSITETIERTFLPSSFQHIDPASAATEAERRLLEQQQQFTEGFKELFANVSSSFRDSARRLGTFGLIGVLVTAGILYASIESVVNQTWQTGNSRWTDTLKNFVLTIVFGPLLLVLSMTASTLAATLFGPDRAPPAATPVAVLDGSAVGTSASQAPPNPAGSATAAADTVTTGAVESIAAASLPEDQIPAEPETLQGSIWSTVRKVLKPFAFVLPILPLLLNTAMLSCAYAFLPNTKVNISAALIGAFVASLLWEVARYTFFYYVYLSSVNRTLADALGLSVVFLIWVYITWLVLLFGVVVTFLTQNYRSLWTERRTSGETMLDARLVVAVMLLIAHRFRAHREPLKEHEIRGRLGLRKQEFEQLMRALLRGGFVQRSESQGYMPSMPLEDIRLQELLSLGCNLSKVPLAGRLHGVGDVLRGLQQTMLTGAGEQRLSDLVPR
jgi:uncharacterized BrkB/YihY/UPF0761 family membrane protein